MVTIRAKMLYLLMLKLSKSVSYKMFALRGRTVVIPFMDFSQNACSVFFQKCAILFVLISQIYNHLSLKTKWIEIVSQVTLFLFQDIQNISHKLSTSMF